MTQQRDEQFQSEALPHIDDVYRFALALTGSVADAEDATQDTFLRAFRSWHTYSPGTQCRRWLFTICRNIIRNNSARPPMLELDAFDAETETLTAVLHHSGLVREGAELSLDGSLVTGAIDRAIATLPEPFRTAVLLVDVEDQSYQDAADILDVPVGTVRSRLFRGRRLLQEQLVSHARDAGLRAQPAAS